MGISFISDIISENFAREDGRDGRRLAANLVAHGHRCIDAITLMGDPLERVKEKEIDSD